MREKEGIKNCLRLSEHFLPSLTSVFQLQNTGITPGGRKPGRESRGREVRISREPWILENVIFKEVNAGDFKVEPITVSNYKFFLSCITTLWLRKIHYGKYFSGNRHIGNNSFISSVLKLILLWKARHYTLCPFSPHLAFVCKIPSEISHSPLKLVAGEDTEKRYIETAGSWAFTALTEG